MSEVLEYQLKEYCRSDDSLSERGLRELFERHDLTPGNQNRLSNYHFIFHACRNERVTEGIIQCLLEYFPAAASATTEYGWSPLHSACYHQKVTPNIIRLLLDAAPTSVRSVNSKGKMPLHFLCEDKDEDGEIIPLDGATALEILNLLIEMYPEAASHADIYGCLPIHHACEWRSPGFCRVLINTAPDSVRSVDNYGYTPLHRLCMNKQVDDAVAMQILNLLIDNHPAAARHASNHGILPIHVASSGEKSREFCQVLIVAAPDSVRSVDRSGRTPLHYSCSRRDDAAAMQVLNLLINNHPAAVRHTDNYGNLPIHLASGWWRTPELLRVLVEAYPGSVSTPNDKGLLPLHEACFGKGSLATVEYLYRQYPNAIDHAAIHPIPGHRAVSEYFSIHLAIESVIRYDPAAAVEIVQFLLNCDPNQKLIQLQGKSLLHHACEMRYKSSNIEAGIQLMKVLFDAHPEAIENNGITSNIHRFDQQVQAFINSELVYARLAKDHRLMTTADDNGQLPLHRALQINVRLGSIKLLVNGNPLALRAIDNDFAMPLHIACEHHDSAGVVPYLIERHTLALEAVDRQGNTVLHYACRGAKHGNIGLLLETYDAVSVSKRNADGKLPIDLLWESKEVSDRESVEYTESVFRLLRANPEMINQ